MWFLANTRTGNNVFLPASVTFAGVLALLIIFSLFRYSTAFQGKRPVNAKADGRGVRRSTRERKEVSRWTPEKPMSDSPANKRGAKTPVTAAVKKVMAVTEGVIASPTSAVKKTRPTKSVGATATSPSPPKLRSRQTPAKA